MNIKKGYYWILFDGEITIGYNDGSGHLDWQVIGSDEIFNTEERSALSHHNFTIKIIKKLKVPKLKKNG